MTAVEDGMGSPYLNLWGFKPKTHSLLDLSGAGPLVYLELVHSNVRAKEMDAHFAQREEEAMQYVHRGEYRTFAIEAWARNRARNRDIERL